MKLLLLACILGFAAADLLQQSAPAVDEAALAFFQGAVKAGSLSSVLGVRDREIEQMADDMESHIGQKIKEAVKEFLERIKDHVENSKEVAKELLDKVKELRNKLKELGEEDVEKSKEYIRQIREKAREALRKILDRLGLGKRNLDDNMDQIARLKFRDIVDKIKEKIVNDETVQKLREYVKNLYGDSKVVRKVKQLFEKLHDADIKDILDHIFEYRPFEQRGMVMRGEGWEKVKNFFKDLNIKIQEHSKKFGEWVKDMWSKGIDKLKEKHGTIKAIAMEFIANSKDMSAEMAREALEFFRPYKEDLGTLWNKLVDATKEAIGRF